MADEKPTNVVCVCAKCRHSQHNSYVEINFGDRTIYWMCPECKEMNELLFPTAAHAPFPKSSTMGRRRGR